MPISNAKAGKTCVLRTQSHWGSHPLCVGVELAQMLCNSGQYLVLHLLCISRYPAFYSSKTWTCAHQDVPQNTRQLHSPRPDSGRIEGKAAEQWDGGWAVEASCQGLCSVGRTHTSSWAKAPGRRAPATRCHGPGGHSKSQSLEWDAEWPLSQNKTEGAEAASASCHPGVYDCDESRSSMFPVCAPCVPCVCRVCALRMLLFHLKSKERKVSQL